MNRIEELNKRLIDRYGKTLSGEAHFRLVWSNDLFEHRKGTFNEFYGRIFLRTVKGIKLCRKYNYINDRWLLEMWRYTENPPQEIVDPDNYDCVYVFEDKDGNPLPIEERVLEIIIFNILHPLDACQLKQLYEDANIKLFNDDVKYFEDLFSNSMSAMMSRFHFGEAIIMPRRKYGDN